MDWKRGYFAEAGYTYGYYEETMPSRLYLAALLQGYLAPRESFRYLDAGCGQGFNLIVAAINHPDSEFVGIDFMPEHIAHGRALAARLKLNNISFIEADFTELAQHPNALGEFDYAVCHGISTWISPGVRAELFKLIGAVLKPAGIFYNSYNTFPGWLGVSPFQHLVSLHQHQMSGQDALNTAIEAIKQLHQHSPRMTKALPALMGRVEGMAKHEPAYLVQEYNNKFWQPVYVSQMMQELAQVKLSYMGTASIPEMNEASWSQPLRDLISKQNDPVVREQLIDYATNQSFRRDLYVKGRVKPWAGQLQAGRANLRFVVNPLAEVVADDQPFVFKGGSAEVSHQSTVYNKLIKQVAGSSAGLTFQEIQNNWPDIQQAHRLMASLGLLVHSRHLFVENTCSGLDNKATQTVFGVLCDAALEGAPYKFIPLPHVGQALAMSESKWAMLRCHLLDLPHAQWADQVASDIRGLGLSFMKDGKVTENAEDIRMLINAAIEEFRRVQLKMLVKSCLIDE
ncbi:methyltransferase family protein [Limnobacter thiooxidans]|uniref:Class I SAM-dependent methyltransferase n=1 Tax=Limnobacter thiooxidans TaxID=131080 RepID=A0AA86IY98_9BURK|nr:methyltransferase family protein [Limnobacter thiooxidans]BET25654.1 class I SAM-dependent methyltransferase [Limnobacter thiooxidans]